MTIALIILSTLLGVANAASGFGKLQRVPQVVEMMGRVGVSKQQTAQLGLLQILGALGLLVGIWVPLIGQAAAVALALYFAGAIIAHLRAKTPASTYGPPVFLFVLAVATSVLQLMR